MKVIIYPNESGTISIVFPTGDLPIEEVAQKDVPAGVPFRYADTKDFPSDPGTRDAWTADFSSPDGHGIGSEAWWDEWTKKQEVQS